MPILCTALVALLAAAGPPPPSLAATLVVANRDVMTFRATVAGSAPAERVHEAILRIDAMSPAALDEPVTAEPGTAGDERGYVVRIGRRIAFTVAEGDRDPLSEQYPAELAAAAAERLGAALRAQHDQRSLRVVLRGLWQSGVATVVLAVALWILVRLRRVIVGALSRLAGRGATALLGGRIDLGPVVRSAVRSVAFVLFWSTAALLVNVWITFVLGRFPLTAPWADVLTDRVVGILATVGLAMVHALPGLVTVGVILLVAHFVAGFLKGILDRVERGALAIPGVYPETVSATRRIVAAGVWLVALAAAYPYIPGSDSEAVKGLSLLVGVVFSLGSSGVVSQAMSGLALIYSRALSTGDVVRVGDVEGVVTQVGLLSTKLVTIPGEEVTFPNSVVIGGSVRNYTRLAGGGGPLVTTSVTIGYDAPWREVHALLLGAAAGTPGLVRDPAPFVLQRALADFYVEYQLVARQEGDPADRPRVLSELHGKVQDAFNAAGVQIMSPHFVLQPKAPVVVPPERWGPTAAPEPAEPPAREHG